MSDAHDDEHVVLRRSSDRRPSGAAILGAVVAIIGIAVTGAALVSLYDGDSAIVMSLLGMLIVPTVVSLVNLLSSERIRVRADRNAQMLSKTVTALNGELETKVRKAVRSELVGDKPAKSEE